MILVSELGEIHRFGHPRQVMAYLGLVPTEKTSVTNGARGASPSAATPTPAGCWWNAPNTTRTTQSLRPPQSSSAGSISASARDQLARADRLHARYTRLLGDGSSATRRWWRSARALGFIWELFARSPVTRRKPLRCQEQKSSRGTVTNQMNQGETYRETTDHTKTGADLRRQDHGSQPTMSRCVRVGAIQVEHASPRLLDKAAVN